MLQDSWQRENSALADVVRHQRELVLETYAGDPKRIREDANNEQTIIEGAYRTRQVFELVQNAVDALDSNGAGRIEVVVANGNLYVANSGEPFTKEGVIGVLTSHLSNKRDEKIGRFGLGFKSVLAVSASPTVYSRTGSFTFRPRESRLDIEQVLKQKLLNLESSTKSEAVMARRSEVETQLRALGTRAPRLRIAYPVDPQLARANDPVLAELMQWAATVVQVPLDHDPDRIIQDVRSFPAEFMLFSKHVREFVSRVDGERSEYAVQRDGARVQLTSGRAKLDWLVFERTHRTSAAALAEAGEIGGRDHVQVRWAVPLGPSDYRVGKFWAYFPTKEETTLSGIVNAPWRLSEDRERVLEGAFNRELLEEVMPTLVAAALPIVAQHVSPGSLVDLLPARGRETRTWADGVINEPVMTALAGAPSLPDCKGVLRRPAALQIPPSRESGQDGELLNEWSRFVRKAGEWLHPECVSNNERRSKVQRLAGRGAAHYRAWIESAVDVESMPSLAFAIRAAAAAGDSLQAEDLEKMRILPTLTGVAVTVRPERVFLAQSNDAPEQDHLVDPKILEFPGVAAALESLGIRVHDKNVQLRDMAFKAKDGKDWQRVWREARAMKPWDAHVALTRVLGSGKELMLRNERGTWLPSSRLFTPGSIVGEANADHDRGSRVDMEWHGEDVELLNYLGVREAPVPQGSHPDEPWMIEWADRTRAKLANEGRSVPAAVWEAFVEEQPRYRPLSGFRDLSPAAAHRLTLRLASLGALERWSGKGLHTESAAAALVLEHGYVSTTWGLMPVRLALWPSQADWEDGYPVATELDRAPALIPGVHVEPTYTADEWRELFKAAHGIEHAARVRFYAWAGAEAVAGQDVGLPLHVMAEGAEGPIPVRREDVLVTDSEDYAEQLKDANLPVLLVPSEDVDGLISGLGMASSDGKIDQSLEYKTQGEAVPLTDEFAQLKLWDGLTSHDLEVLRLVPCESIDIVYSTSAGTSRVAKDAWLTGNDLLVTGSSDIEQLRQVDGLINLNLNEEEFESVIARRREPVPADAQALKALPTDADRLADLVPVDILLSALPKQALAQLREEGHDLSPVKAAELVLAVEGPSILDKAAVKKVFAEKGLDVPVRNGGTKARRWAASLGFDESFAGEPSSALPAFETIPGRIELKPLHDYQEICREAIVDVLGHRHGYQPRGMLSLPTGAGKTRVAVEALVDSVANESLKSRAIWIAQSNELCEQAVQSILSVWNAKAPSRALHVSRAWAGNRLVEPQDGSFHVVVCTYQQLVSWSKIRDEYDWLTNPDVIVIDEAHGATARSYTEIVEWLSGTSWQRSTLPLIGLSATPFRGTSEEETRRLVNRFGQRRFDMDAFADDENRYQNLQNRGILARVQQREIRGVDVSLSPAERQQAIGMNWLPKSVETKLGKDLERTSRIVEQVRSLPEDWPILVFAPSVDNSEDLATLLTAKGRRARSIIGKTPAPERERAIQQFKEGQIKVLTNYNVLTQGFDAPMVRAVVVARPTSSMNLYQQMIGRGLRGPLNGGSEEVLILNVADNIRNYGQEMAFQQFERLWKEED